MLLWSRLASRVLLHLREEEVNDERQLYDAAAALPWEAHFSPAEGFAVDAESLRSPLRNSTYAALKVKDAIADRFRRTAGSRPSVNTEHPDIRVRLHLSGDRAHFYLDLSGESLHRRGYRISATEAPLRETAAAGMLLRARWPEIAGEGGCFCDPMCGSGTLPIEAALMAGDVAPGLLRERFGIHAWKQHDAALWREMRREAEERRAAGIAALPPINAFDIDAEAVRITGENVARAGLGEVIRVERCDMRRLERGRAAGSKARRGLIAVNPPYGVRLEEKGRVSALYEELGKWLSQQLQGFRAAVLAPDRETARRIGLRAEKLNTFYNGNLKIVMASIEVDADNRFVPNSGQVSLPRPDDDPTSGVNTLINRLKKNRRALKKYLKQNEVHCYRIYDADIPQYSAAIDVYEGEHFVIQEYAPPKTIPPAQAQRHLRELQGAVVHYFDTTRERLYVKQRNRQRGTSQYEKAGNEGERYIVREGGLRFFVNFTDYLDTGLFLDHRETRKMLRERAEGCRVLNLFAYTCTASVYAAAGGARSTVSVDTSNTYLDWGRQNFRLNKLPLDPHRFVRQDVFTFLRSELGSYDLIFVDPPTFSNRKGRDADFDIQRDHPLLLELAAERLAEGGSLIFSNNYRRFELDPGVKERWEVREISSVTVPPDFARQSDIHHSFLMHLR
jgi:23S rRNA (guanine2445-N2)-methyltransferase / 23S rRNA (guanine2069-N7)-methyltransferase